MNRLYVLMLKTLLETLPGGISRGTALHREQQVVVCTVTHHFDCFLSIPKICSSKVALHFC